MIMFLSGKIISGNNCYFQSNQSQSVVPLVWIAVMLDFVYVIYKLIREFNIDLGKIKQKKCEKMWLKLACQQIWQILMRPSFFTSFVTPLIFYVSL